jgi:hypothetical protein
MDKQGTCEECGDSFAMPAWQRGQPRLYCRDGCRSRATSRAYRQRQKRKLEEALAEATAPTVSDSEVRQAVDEAFAVLAELRALRSGLRVPQRMDEAHEQVRSARTALERLTERLEHAVRAVARQSPG